jgi:hypothetical protein
MIKRLYFMSAKVTEGTGYCYTSRLTPYSSIFSDGNFAFNDMAKKLKDELLAIRPNGQFEVVSFNRV